jgi:hypothetical protein
MGAKVKVLAVQLVSYEEEGESATIHFWRDGLNN